MIAYPCCTQYRLQDNMTEEQLESLADQGIDLPDDDRRPLCVDGVYKLLPCGTAACVAHSAVGCERCFNFERRVMDD
jgi:hypothetical protein